MFVSIIIPTLNEEASISVLISELRKVLEHVSFEYEILIVDDDSSDNSHVIFNEISRDSKINVYIRKWKWGLSSAIVDGFCWAKGDVFLALDADLSHEIKAIPKLVDAIINGGYQMAIGSRYIKGGKIKNWPFKRRVFSVVAKTFACFLSDVKDPLSGFFAIKRELLNGVKLNTTGFKICLELIVKTRCVKIKEVPYLFTDRWFGESKVSLQVMLGYITQLIDLYNFRFRQCSKR